MSEIRGLRILSLIFFLQPGGTDLDFYDFGIRPTSIYFPVRFARSATPSLWGAAIIGAARFPLLLIAFTIASYYLIHSLNRSVCGAEAPLLIFLRRRCFRYRPYQVFSEDVRSHIGVGRYPARRDRCSVSDRDRRRVSYPRHGPHARELQLP